MSLLRDEYGAKLAHPAQIRYCSSDTEDIIGKALERTAHVFGCLTCTEEEVRQVALSDEYGYKNLLNRALSEADIAGIGRASSKGLLVTSIWVGLDHLVRIHMFLASLMVLTARGVT